MIWVFLVDSFMVVNIAGILGGIVGFMGAVAALATTQPKETSITGLGLGCLTGCFVGPVVVFIAYSIGITISGDYEPEMIFGMIHCSLIVSLSGGVGGFAALYAARK